MDPKQRFSSRVENYVKYRPGYPRAILDVLKAECRLTPRSVIADIGSGTGKLAELFLQNGNKVFGVEPNPEMRAAGERLLAEFPRYLSIDGSAEGTTLSDRCADFVTAGQSFHWFDLPRARMEFSRIIKPQGWVVLVWNERRSHGSAFMRDYEELIANFATDSAAVRASRFDIGLIQSFFGRSGFKLKVLDQQQVFNLEGLRGRLLSSSYAPQQGHTGFEPMMADLDRIFLAYQVADRVVFEYETKMYYGQLSS